MSSMPSNSRSRPFSEKLHLAVERQSEDMITSRPHQDFKSTIKVVSREFTNLLINIHPDSWSVKKSSEWCALIGHDDDYIKEGRSSLKTSIISGTLICNALLFDTVKLFSQAEPNLKMLVRKDAMDHTCKHCDKDKLEFACIRNIACSGYIPWKRGAILFHCQ